MNFSKLKHVVLLFTFGALMLMQSPQLQAQDDGGLGGQIADQAFGDSGGSAGDTGGGEGLEGAAELDFGGDNTDNRNQGFIGATAPGVSANNFVGAASTTFGGLAEGATFGGGVNEGGGQGGAGGFTGTTSGSVIRSNIRTRLRPAFAAPVIPPQVTEYNFNNNLARQPSAQSLVGRYQVFVQDKTATVTGVVNSQADADRLIRQLKLQPGIYGIVNQLQVIR